MKKEINVEEIEKVEVEFNPITKLSLAIDQRRATRKAVKALKKSEKAKQRAEFDSLSPEEQKEILKEKWKKIGTATAIGIGVAVGSVIAGYKIATKIGTKTEDEDLVEIEEDEDLVEIEDVEDVPFDSVDEPEEV